MKYYLMPLVLLIYINLFSQAVTLPERKISPVSGAFSGAKIPAAVSGIKIIQACPDSLTLGYVPAGSGNETSKLVAVDKNGNWLNTWISQRYSSNFKTNGSHLLWLLKDLSITTDTSGSYHFTHIRADIYKTATSKSYRKIVLVDTVLTGSVADSNSYAAGLTEALDALYTISLTVLYNESQGNANILQQASGEPASQTEELIKAKISADYLQAILTDTLYHAGAYASISEFIHNTPSITSPIWAQPDTLSGSGHVTILTMGQDSIVHPLTSVWGVCFGGRELYKFEQGKLLPIEKVGNGFVLSRYQEPVVRKNQAFYWRRVMANGWPNDTNPFGRDQTVTVNENKSAGFPAGRLPVATRIDLSTGELTF